MERFFKNKLDFFSSWVGMGITYLDNAEFLLKEKSFMSGFELLFVHAIEILLKAFILMKDDRSQGKIFQEFQKIYGHSHDKLLNRALELDSEHIFSERLQKLIKFHSKFFYDDSIEVRYTDKYAERSFDKDSFSIIRDDLIQPLQIAYIIWRGKYKDDPLGLKN